MVVRTERLVLRSGTDADVPAIVDYVRRNRRYLEPFEPVFPEEYYSAPYWQARVSDEGQGFAYGGRLDLFMFAAQEPGRVIGRVTFSNLVRGVFQACYLGFSIDEGEQGKGYMTEGVRASVAQVFEEHKVHRVMANYMPRNVRSGAVLRKAGFEIEGRARAYLRICGVWEDHVLTSRTNDGWRGE